jgi:hypothetical protein
LTVTGTGTSATHTTGVSLTVNAPNDFSVSASPSSVSGTQGGQVTSTISTAVTSGAAQSVALSLSGQPSGVSGSFSPTSVTAGGSSPLTLTVGASTTPGTYPLTVTGTGASATHTTTVSLTVSAPNSGTPPVAGYAAWYDASDTSTITASSNAVSQWKDKSANAYDLTQSNAASQPLTNSDTLNGHNVVKFDGATSYMRVSNPGSPAQPYTMFAVVKTLRASGGQETIWMPDGDTPGRIYRTSGGNLAAYAGTVLDSGSASGSTNAHVVAVVLNGASGKIAVDGSVTSGNVGSGVIATNYWDIGHNANGGEFAQCDIAELILYPTALNDTDRQSVQSYLKAKWGTP